MDNDKLVTMANQITTFFRAYPDADAAAGIAEHIKAFWTPKMRRTLDERIGASREGVDRLVLLAVAPAGPPAIGESPIEKGIAGPGVEGQLASDAG